ncbi:MAG: YitT family protein, partial [Prevotella sp.]|nr:YitT family protein [Prevotella sp.]
IRDYIVNVLDRSGTCITGQGLYQGRERKLIYVSLNRTNMIKLRAELHNIDPNAFVNIIESSEILGEGFRALPE